jgi:hypothetical protein
VITVDALTKEFAAAGIYINDELLNDMFDYATDSPGDATINFKQFKKLLDSITLEEGEDPTRDSYVPDTSSTDAFSRAVKLGFTSFDLDEDNKLSHADIKESLVEQAFSDGEVAYPNAETLSPQELALLVHAIDKPGCEAISRQAMFNMCSNNKDVFLGKTTLKTKEKKKEVEEEEEE